MISIINTKIFSEEEEKEKERRGIGRDKEEEIRSSLPVSFFASPPVRHLLILPLAIPEDIRIHQQES